MQNYPTLSLRLTVGEVIADHLIARNAIRAETHMISWPSLNEGRTLTLGFVGVRHIQTAACSKIVRA